MAGGNKDNAHAKLRGTREKIERDYAVKADPDIRGAGKPRREAEDYRDSRDERDR